MDLIIGLVVIIGMTIGLIIMWLDSKATKRNAEIRKRQKQEEDEKLMRNIERNLQLVTLMWQSKMVGDEQTYKDVCDCKFEGELPNKNENGSWTTPYQQILIMSVAGINYRSNIDKCIGIGTVRLVPDPKNEFDPKAIKVIHESGIHVGYIPSDRTDEVSRLTPCYAQCDISEHTDKIDDHHFYVGWLYINSSPNLDNNNNK